MTLGRSVSVFFCSLSIACSVSVNCKCGICPGLERPNIENCSNTWGGHTHNKEAGGGSILEEGFFMQGPRDESVWGVVFFGNGGKETGSRTEGRKEGGLEWCSKKGGRMSEKSWVVRPCPSYSQKACQVTRKKVGYNHGSPLSFGLARGRVGPSIFRTKKDKLPSSPSG